MGLYKPKSRAPTTIAEHVADHMRQIKEAFPGVTQLTLVVRCERFKDPLIFTNDQPEEAIKAIRKMTENNASPNLHLAS